jgi:hypothetical protein
MRSARVHHLPAPAVLATTQVQREKLPPSGHNRRGLQLPTGRHYEVLQAVADQRIRRDPLLGSFEPYLLDGRDVIWILRGLVLRGLVQLQPIGPPRLTACGRRTLDSSA